MSLSVRRALPALAALLLALPNLSCGGAEPTPVPVDEDGATSGEPRPPPPDVLLVVVDTLRADHLSTYGYHRPTSPGLDALAAEGTVFTDVTSQSSWTLPSMASMLTGRRMFVNARRLPEAAPSLAERLRDAGYETAAFVANSAVGRGGRFDRGFDHFVNRDDTGGTTWDAPDLEGAVLDWLERHPPGDAPRFYYLHYLDPHWPYEPVGGGELAGEAALSDTTLAAWVGSMPAEGPVREQFDRDRRSILTDLDAYDREIATVDASITRLRERLGVRDHVIVVASDHGECLWDHRHHPKVVAEDLTREGRAPGSATLRDLWFRDHSYHLYQELIATPLIVAGGGVPAGRRVDLPVENVDIVPTLLRAAGLPHDGRLDGLPLQDVARDGLERPFVYSHAKEATAVRRTADGAKLIFPTPTGDWFGMPLMLFDLSRDATERDNRVAGERGSVAADDLDALRQLIRARELAAESFDLFDGEDAEAMDAAGLEAMRQLGYVGSGFETGDGADDEGR